jgi:hypothetical protein
LVDGTGTSFSTGSVRENQPWLDFPYIVIIFYNSVEWMLRFNRRLTDLYLLFRIDSHFPGRRRENVFVKGQADLGAMNRSDGREYLPSTD